MNKPSCCVNCRSLISWPTVHFNIRLNGSTWTIYVFWGGEIVALYMIKVNIFQFDYI